MSNRPRAWRIVVLGLKSGSVGRQMSEAYAETSQRLQKKLHWLKEKMVACEEYKALRREEDRMHIYDLATRIEQLLAPPPASITHEELKQVATTAGVDIVNYLPFLGFQLQTLILCTHQVLLFQQQI